MKICIMRDSTEIAKISYQEQADIFCSFENEVHSMTTL